MNALHIRTTALRDPTDEYIDVVLALEVNVGLGCNNEDAEGLVELVDEAEEIELKSNPFEFHEDSVKSSTFLGGNDGQAEPGLMIDPSHSSNSQSLLLLHPTCSLEMNALLYFRWQENPSISFHHFPFQYPV